MIRVLELIDGGFIGGGQTHILSLCSNLDRGEYETVIAASGEGEFRNLAESSGFRFREIELPKIYTSSALAKLDNLVREENIGLIHSHGGVAGMYSRFHRKKISSVPVVHTIHGIHYIHSSNPFRKFLSKSVEEYLSEHCDAYICVSETDKRLAGKLGIAVPEKISVIKNGIDLNRFGRNSHSSMLMRDLGITDSDFIVGMISRFDEQKNQKFILTNSYDLMERHPDVKILLVGSGKSLEECMKFADEGPFRDRIIFTGEVTDPEMYYPLFDIFIFPSLWEGLSITLIEALASGRCILASAIEANNELIADEYNGLTFDLNDPSEFRVKLELLHNDANLRAELSENAVKSSKDFSAGKMTAAVSEVYKKTSEDWTRR